MKKAYLSPKTESINVETVLLAASTARSTRNSPHTPESRATCSSDWENIWNE